MAKYFYDRYKANYSAGGYSEGPWRTVGGGALGGGGGDITDGWSSYTFSGGRYSTSGSWVSADNTNKTFYTSISGGIARHQVEYVDMGNYLQGYTYIEAKYDRDVTYTDGSYYKGEYVDTIIAEDGAYPKDGRSGNYYYTKKGIANGVTMTSTATNTDESIIVNISKNVEGTTTDIELFVINELGVNVTIRKINNVDGQVVINLNQYEKNQIFASNTKGKTIKYRIKATSKKETDTTIDYTGFIDLAFVGIEPLIGVVAYRDTNVLSVTVTGDDQIIIQNKSLLSFNMANLGPQKNATITSVLIKVGSTIRTYNDVGTTKNFDFGKVSFEKTTPATIEVTDSRGFVTKGTTNITIVPYMTPSITRLEATRTNGYERDSFITYEIVFASVVRNFVTTAYRVRELPSGDFSNWVTTTNDNDVSFNEQTAYISVTKLPAGTYDNLLSYQFEIKGIDPFETVEELFILDKGRGLVIIDENGWEHQEKAKGVSASSGERNYLATLSDVNTYDAGLLSEEYTLQNGAIHIIGGNINGS